MALPCARCILRPYSGLCATMVYMSIMVYLVQQPFIWSGPGISHGDYEHVLVYTRLASGCSQPETLIDTLGKKKGFRLDFNWIGGGIFSK